MAKYYQAGDIHVVEIPVAGFAIKMVDKGKRDCGEDVANAGFFARYTEQGDSFTLPVAHLVCDYEAESPHTRRYCQERGRFQGDKYFFDSSAWSYMNPFAGKAVSTLIVHDGVAEIRDITSLPPCQ